MVEAAEKLKTKGSLWRKLFVISVVAAVLFFYYQSGVWQTPERVRELGYGVQAAAAIILLMGIAWAFALPASAFLFITPLLFPPHISAAITTAGCALGTAAGYLVARYVGGSWVEHFRGGRLARFLTRHSSFLALFGIRLAPGGPHGFINYAAGLAGVPFVRFVVATTAAMSIKSYVYAQAVHHTVGAKSLNDALSGETMLALLGAALLALTGHALRLRFQRNEGLATEAQRHGEEKGKID